MGVNRPTGNKTRVAIGCGSSSSVCRLEEAERLLESGEVEYLAFDRLAERTSAQMHLARTRGLRAYSPQWEDYLTALLPEARRRGVALVSNAGGEDTAAGLDASVRVARDLDLVGLRVAATIPRQDPMEAVRAVDPTVSETGKPVSELDGEVIGATVYESAWPVVEALHDGADVVVTGRVGDSALYMAPLAFEFRWDRDEWDLLARGMAVGHLMECGGQLTGGYYAAPPYKVVPGLASLGLPYAVVDPDGNAEYRKVAGTGGKITAGTVKEQLLYEIGDPARYVHTDVVVDFTGATISDLDDDRVRMEGIAGHPAPETLKVLLAVREGFIGESYVTFGGGGALERAQLAAETMRERVDIMGLPLLEFRAGFMGIDSLGRGWGDGAVVPREVTLHLAARFRTRKAAEEFVFDAFMGAGNHYAPAAGTPGRQLLPVDDTPSIYTTFIDKEDMKPSMLEIREA